MFASKPSSVAFRAVILIAAASVFAVLAAPDAWAKTKRDRACRYDTSEARAAYKKRDLRRAAELFTEAIAWTEKNCKRLGWSRSGLWQAYKFRAAAYSYLKEYEKSVRDLVTMSQATLQKWGAGEEKWVFAAYDGAVRRNPNDPFFRGARASFYEGWIPDDSKLKEKLRRTALADRNAQLKLAKTDSERAEALADRARLYSSSRGLLGCRAEECGKTGTRPRPDTKL